MKIGNLELTHKLLLAPMADVTDSSFRKVCKEHGAGLTYTQMVSALGVINNEFETLQHLSFSRSERPIGVQILGSDPGIVGEAVKEISKLKPSIIDLNAGCPSDKVTTHSFGSALLDDPKALGKIIKIMVDNSNGIPISVKLRLGKDKNHINIIETSRVVEDSGASLIVVHARTRADKYESDSQWYWIRKVKENSKIAIAGNGSVFSPQDAMRMLEETGCDLVMVGRGSLGNPFLFSRFNLLAEKGFDPGHPSVEIAKEVLLKQLESLKRDSGELVALDKAKKHTIWYLRFYPGLNELLKNIFGIKSFDKLTANIEDHVDKILKCVFSTQDLVDVTEKFKKKVVFWLLDSLMPELG